MTASTIKRLSELSQLQPGWDSYGGQPPTWDALSTAAVVAQWCRSETQPAIVPRSDGGLQLEWYRDDLKVVVCIGPDGEQDE